MNSSPTVLVARHLWQRIFSSRTIYLLGSIYIFLLILALYVSWRGFLADNYLKTKYHEASYNDFVNNPDKHPHRMAHYGHFAFRKPSALSLFDPGLNSFMGNSIFLEAHVQNSTNFSNASLSTGLLRFGEISISMILQLLIPLLIIFIGFDTVSGDRENGTLKILFVHGVDWKPLIAGNSLGLLAIILVFLIPVFLCFVLGAFMLPELQFNLDVTIRILLLVFIYLTYFYLWCFITVWFSTWFKTSRTSLVSLLGVWLLFAIIIPRSMQSLGTLIYEIPSKSEFTKRIEEDILKVGDSHNADDPHFKALKDSVLSVYNIDSVEQLPFDYMGFQIQEGEKISTTIFVNHYDSLLNLYEKQNSLSSLAGIINPCIAIKNLSMALSNTDYTSYAEFQKQAEEYRFSFVSRLNELHMKRTSDHEHWAEIAPFQYKPRKLSDIINKEYAFIISVVLWLLVIYISYAAFSKKMKEI